MSAVTSQQADVVVVGAGPAGSTAARLLAIQGWDVLLVDRARFPRPKTCGDGLTPRAVATLQRLGQLAPLLEAGYLRIEGARLVAPAGHEWRARFDEYGRPLPEFGLVAPRLELDDLLRQQAVEAGARFMDGFRAQAARRDGDGVTGVVGAHNGDTLSIHALLTIAATGVGMTMPRALGVLRERPPLVHAARVYFEGVDGLGSEFEFHFRRQFRPGYGWIFPAGQGRANVGLGLFPSNGHPSAGHLRSLLESWLEQGDMAARFRAARRLSPIVSYPIRADYPDHRVHGVGFLLAGEAAGLVNPITGEGIDLALESGELAARAADRALRRDDLSARGLCLYERELRHRFGAWFVEVRRMQELLMKPRALNILIAKGQRWPALGRMLLGIVLGTRSPHLAYSPLTWFYLLF